MEKPRIALIVDHPQRDLAGMVLTAFELCQRGAVCHLVPLNLQDYELWALAPDFVLLNFMRRGTEHLAKQMIAAQIQFGLLDTEGGIWPDPENYTELLWNDTALLHQASCICMWGPRLAKYTTAQGFFRPSQVIITGCSRFDFYEQRWRGLFRVADQDERTRRAKRILINTNYTTVNSRIVSAAANVAQFRAIFGWSDERIGRLVDAEEQAIAATIDMARELARTYPHSEIVVRPHPFENPERYRRGLGDLENIEINTTGPVQPQIFRASVVIQRSCTTAIEACLAAVPTLSPQWIPAPNLMPMSEAVSVPCASYQDMHAQIEAIFAGQYVPSADLQHAIDTVIQDWFYQIDGLAYRRVSDAVLGRIHRRRVVNERQCSRYLYGLDISRSSWRRSVSANLRYRVGLSPDWSFQQMRKIPMRLKPEKSFGTAEVRDLAGRIYQARCTHDRGARPVTVVSSGDRGDYTHHYTGHAVTLSCETTSVEMPA
jgi:surface carbohydrate biosynthesis protein